MNDNDVKKIFTVCHYEQKLNDALISKNSFIEFSSPYRYIFQRIIRIFYPATSDFSQMIHLDYLDDSINEWRPYKRILFNFNKTPNDLTADLRNFNSNEMKIYASPTFGQPIIHGDNLFIFGYYASIKMSLSTGNFINLNGIELYYENHVIIDDDIYIFGRNLGYGCEIRKYSIVANVFTLIPETLKFRGIYSCAVAAYENTIFVAGGSDTRARDCKFVAKYYTETQMWNRYPRMGSDRSSFVLVVMGEFMYAINGDCKSAERLDFKTTNWEEAS